MAKKDFSQALRRTSEPKPALKPELAPAPSAMEQAVEEPLTTAPARTTLADRLERAASMAQRDGLLKSEPPEVFTKEAAIASGRPLRRHRVSELTLHPQNPRPVSGGEALDDLRSDMRRHGQKDPIHIVPFKDGWGIMEGQRRWLIAQLENIEYLDCFEHPPMEPIQVYAFGMSIHHTRRTQTAIDEARGLQALLETGLSRAKVIEELARDGGVTLTEVDLSRMLAINGCHDDVLRHVLAKPSAFTHRHLYALSQVHKKINVQRAVEIAESVRFAPDDKPVTALSIERQLEKDYAAGGARRTRTASIPRKIRSTDGQDVGLCRAYKGGRVEFTPEVSLTEKEVEGLHEVISEAVSKFYAERDAD